MYFGTWVADQFHDVFFVNHHTILQLLHFYLIVPMLQILLLHSCIQLNQNLIKKLFFDLEIFQ